MNVKNLHCQCSVDIYRKFHGEWRYHFLAIVQKIFRDNLQIPFNEASLRSIPKINSMDVTQELSSLNATQRDEFNNLMDTMLEAIELNPYYQEKVKRGARTYLNAIKATSQLGQF